MPNPPDRYTLEGGLLWGSSGVFEPLSGSTAIKRCGEMSMLSKRPRKAPKRALPKLPETEAASERAEEEEEGGNSLEWFTKGKSLSDGELGRLQLDMVRLMPPICRRLVTLAEKIEAEKRAPTYLERQSFEAMCRQTVDTESTSPTFIKVVRHRFLACVNDDLSEEEGSSPPTQVKAAETGVPHGFWEDEPGLGYGRVIPGEKAFLDEALANGEAARKQASLNSMHCFDVLSEARSLFKDTRDIRTIQLINNGNVHYVAVNGARLKDEGTNTFRFPVSKDGAEKTFELMVIPTKLYVGNAGKKEKPLAFSFDRVFGGEASQTEVFEDVSHLVRSALDGYKVCVFAYGQTGSGKTYTMLGDGGEDGSTLDRGDADGGASRGLIPRCVERIFAARDAAARAADAAEPFAVTATMVEIYNEEIRDLLAASSTKTVDESHGGASSKLDVKHDARTGETSVTNARCVEVASAKEIASLLRRADAARTTRGTNMNDRSSRSHMVFTLKLTGIRTDAGSKKHPNACHGVLNLVDLAGSERLSRTGATGDRLKEAQNINKSLSALGDVIAALAEKAAHVPYRNSKLTYLLQNALGGDAKTLMVANVSPVAESAQETLCSLRFATKVNACAAGGRK